MKKPIREFELRNVDADDLINQAKGLKLVKERKRQEKHMINYIKHIAWRRIYKRHDGCHQTISDQIQRGFDIATKWRNEDVQE